MVMRVYFDKPRTTVGWKGLINDPNLDGTCDMNQGLQQGPQDSAGASTRWGCPAGTEMLEMVTPQYVADLVSWGAIGARTTESQAHRQLASGLSMPIGYKNGTDGNLQAAINAMVAARAPQTFLGVDQEGYTCIVQTNGNPMGHIVLRGGRRPNYDPISITEARLGLIEHRLPEAIMVDCSHGNSWKKFQGQEMAWRSVVEQRLGRQRHPGRRSCSRATSARATRSSGGTRPSDIRGVHHGRVHLVGDDRATRAVGGGEARRRRMSGRRRRRTCT